MGLSIHVQWEDGTLPEESTMITVSNNHSVSLNEEETEEEGRDEVSEAESYVYLANMFIIESLKNQCDRALHTQNNASNVWD